MTEATHGSCCKGVETCVTSVCDTAKELCTAGMEISPLVTKCHPHLIGIPFLFKVLKVIAKCGERE
jgi:hypothetical protein